MLAKALEVRDDGTFIAVLAVDMNPNHDPRLSPDSSSKQRWLLRRCGYRCDMSPNVIITRLDGAGQATNDPYAWAGCARTMPAAHHYIIDHWNELRDGDVIDVQFILGETSTPRQSERETVT